MNIPIPATPKAQQRGANLLLIAVLIVTVVTVGIGLATLSAAAGSRSNTEAARRTDELSACMSQANAVKETAALDVTATQSQLTVASSDLAQAWLEEDHAQVLVLNDRMDALQLQMNAALDRLAETTAAYAAAADRRDIDPDGFLAACNTTPSEGPP